MAATRQLFGGAITATLPAKLIDASDLRQVPDTQEVFLGPDSDLSLIVEVLELATDEGARESLEAAAKFHFSALAHDNDALSSSISSLDLPTPDSSSTTPSQIVGPTILKGIQTVSKFNKGADEADEVLILFGLWRVPSKKADLTLCVNFPLRMGETGKENDAGEARRVFDEAVASLRVEDFGLFAGGDE